MSIPSIDDVLKGASNSPSSMPSIDDVLSPKSSTGMPSIDSVLGTQPSSSGGWHGILDNPIGRGVGNVLGSIGKGLTNFENFTGLNKVGGAMKGLTDPTFQPPIQPTDNSYLGLLKATGSNLLQDVGDYGKSIAQGYNNPDATTQKFNTDLNSMTKSFDPVSRTALNFAGQGMTDPLSFVPVGAAAKGLSKLSDVAGLTPYLSKGADLINNSPLINNGLVNGAKDRLGSMFVKNYGVTPEVASGLDELQGARAGDSYAINQKMHELQQAHGLNGEQMAELPHVIEGQMSLDPQVNQAAQDLKSMQNEFKTTDGRSLGTQAELNTTFKDNPILSATRDNYYPHRYANTLEEINQAFAGAKPGYSVNGPFNQERSFNTVQDALDAGLKPEMNPYVAIGQRLGESSKSLRNADFLNSLIDKGIISKEANAGLQASKLNPVDGFNTILDSKAVGTSPLSAFMSDLKNPLNPNVSEAIKPQSLPLTADVQSAIDKLDGDFKAYKDNANSQVASGAWNADEAAKAIKGRAMAIAAQKRTLVQGDSLIPVDGGHTAKELENNIAKMRTNYAGKEVTVGGMDGTVSSSQFGKVTVTLQNGIKKTVDPALVTPKVDIDALIAEQKSAAAKASALNPIVKPIEPVIPLGQGASDLSDPNNFHSLTNSLEQAQPAGKIVKTNPFFIKPQDEQALKQYLDPIVKDNLFDKTTSLYKKYGLMNSAVHGHNIAYNGMYLGGAKAEQVGETMKNLRSNTYDPWVERATRAGAVKQDAGALKQSLADSFNKPANIASQTWDKMKYAFHGALWDADKGMRTSIFRQAVEGGATDTAAAAKANNYLVNYNNLTPFEQKVMTRVFPFYNWMKGNMPLQAEQWINSTPKQMLFEHAKDALSQSLSGTDTHDGKINTSVGVGPKQIQMVDPYAPVDEPAKVGREGILPFLYARMNPLIKEAIAQITNKAYFPTKALAPSGKGGMANIEIAHNGAPGEYNLSHRLAHAANSLNPFGSSVIGQGLNDSGNNPIDRAFGIADKSKPSITPIELGSKLLGAFPSRVDLQKEQYYLKQEQHTDHNGAVLYRKSLNK